MHSIHDFPDMQNKAHIAVSALAQTTRLEAFRLLSNASEQGLGAGAIASLLGVPHNTLSTHLAILQRADLIASKKVGRNITYYIVPGCLAFLINFLEMECQTAMPAKGLEQTKVGASFPSH